MTVYIGYDKNNNEVIRSIYKDLVKAHISVSLVVKEDDNKNVKSQDK